MTGPQRAAAHQSMYTAVSDASGGVCSRGTVGGPNSISSMLDAHGSAYNREATAGSEEGIANGNGKKSGKKGKGGKKGRGKKGKGSKGTGKGQKGSKSRDTADG